MHEELMTSVVFKDEARQSLLKGMAIVAEAVGCTLGPRGKTVIIQQPGLAPIVTKDGVTVSKAINLKDPIAGMGADLVKQAAERTNEVAGDGTTTATVLTYALVVEGNKLVSSGHYNPQQICRGIDKAIAAVISALRQSARPVTTQEELAHVATISANGDATIGELVAQAMEKVGRDGIITVEDAKGMNTSLEVVEGLQFDRGYLSPYFVTNPDKMHVTYNEARVLITDKKLSDFRQIQHILEKVSASRLPLLIIADDVEGDALQGLVINRVKGNLPVVAVKAPGYGTFKDELLNDLCALTGAKLVSSKTGLSLDKAELGDTGSVKKVVVDARSTTLVASGQTADAVKQRIAELRSQLEDVTLNVDEVTRLRTRIARLSAGVAVVRVGGSTEVEMVERKHRIEDALNATRAAAEEGIIPGGGMALVSIAKALEPTLDDGMTADEAEGVRIVLKACLAPVRRIVENTGQVPEVVLNELGRRPGTGYDASTGEYVDMVAQGIIDPVKVCRTALQNAASVATTFLTLDAVVYTDKEKQHDDDSR